MTRTNTFSGLVGAVGLALFLWTVATPAQAWLTGEEHPVQREISAWVETDFPDYHEIISVEIGSQHIRRGATEYSESRIRIVLQPREDLYFRGEQLPDGTVVVEATPTGTPGSQIELFALLRAHPTGRGWDGDVILDEDSLAAARNAGVPRGNISNRTVVAGSPEHTAMVAAFDQERIARLDSVSGEFSGLMRCEEAYRVRRLVLDAHSGRGLISYRVPGLASVGWMEDRLTVRLMPDDTFRVSGLAMFGTFMAVENRDGTVVLSNAACTSSVRPIDAAPDTSTR